MAQQKFSINLKEAAFPLVSSMKGKAVLIPNLDQERELPQLYWMENVVPTARGVTTPSILPVIAANPVFGIDPAALDNCDVHTVHSKEGTSTYLVIYGTKHYLYDIREGTWLLVADTVAIETTVRTSVFYLKGQSWIFHPSIGLNVLNEFCTSLVSKTVVGLVLTEIVSMSAALSYIVATDGETIYWSSPLNELSFDPTGTGEDDNAGSTKVLMVKGDINILTPTAKGFMVYAAATASEVLYTGNAANPWRFVPILNSTGVFKPWHQTQESHGSIHFIWGDTGLQAISGGQAQAVHPEVSDFLTGTIYEEFDEVARGLVTFPVVDAIGVRVAFVANRYLCISYGRTATGISTYILVHDMVLGRWGRIRKDHLSVFNLDLPQRPDAVYADAIDSNITDEAVDYDVQFANDFLPGDNSQNFRAAKFGIFTADGAIEEINLSDHDNNMAGRIIYGEIALTRSRFSEIIEVELAGINTGVTVSGKSEYETRVWSPWIPFFYATPIDVYQEQIAGRRHEILLEGAMYLSTVVITTTAQGNT